MYLRKKKQKSLLGKAVVNREILYSSVCVYALDKLPKQSQVFIILFCLSFFSPSIRFLPVSTVVKRAVILRGGMSASCINLGARNATPGFFHVHLDLYTPCFHYMCIYWYTGVYIVNIWVVIFLAVHHLVGSIADLLKTKKDWKLFMVFGRYHVHYISDSLSNNSVIHTVYFFFHFCCLISTFFFTGGVV